MCSHFPCQLSIGQVPQKCSLEKITSSNLTPWLSDMQGVWLTKALLQQYMYSSYATSNDYTTITASLQNSSQLLQLDRFAGVIQG